MTTSGKTADAAPWGSRLHAGTERSEALLGVVRLLPLLAVLLAATYALPSRPDDEAAYVSLAERLTQGSYTTGDQDAIIDEHPASPDLWFGPGLPMVLAPFVALDLPVTAMRATGPIFLFAATVLFFLLARMTVSRPAALAASYALGLYWPSWRLLPNLHSEPLAILFLVAGIYLLARGLRDGRLSQLACSGAAFAGLAVTRVAFGWIVAAALVALTGLWAVRRTAALGRSLLPFAVALALCTPWLAFTYHETGRPFLWGNSGGLSLYWMSSPFPGDLGDWHQADDVFTDPRLAAHRPFFEGLRGRPLADQVAAIERRALEQIVANPRAYAGNVVANVSRLLFDTPYSFQTQRVRAFAYALPNAVLVGALALALVLALARDRDRPPAPPETAAVGVVTAGTLGLHALVAAYPRMLMPAVPLLLWLLVVALRRRALVGPP